MISTTPYPIAYCLNVHRADTLSDVLYAIETGVIPVRDLVAPGCLFPVSLYLSDTAARELDAVPRRLESFRHCLAHPRVSSGRHRLRTLLGASTNDGDGATPGRGTPAGLGSAGGGVMPCWK